MANSIELGSFVKDQITGFEGRATGKVAYISGCNQVLVTPSVGEKGELRSAEWFDEQRLIADANLDIIRLDNSKTPGFDRPAPKR